MKIKDIKPYENNDDFNRFLLILTERISESMKLGTSFYIKIFPGYVDYVDEPMIKCNGKM